MSQHNPTPGCSICANEARKGIDDPHECPPTAPKPLPPLEVVLICLLILFALAVAAGVAVVLQEPRP